MAADRETCRWTASTNITEALHAPDSLIERLDHDGVDDDDPPPHRCGEEVEHLREPAGPPDKRGVEPVDARKDVYCIALEELDVSGAGGCRLPRA